VGHVGRAGIRHSNKEDTSRRMRQRLKFAVGFEAKILPPLEEMMEQITPDENAILAFRGERTTIGDSYQIHPASQRQRCLHCSPTRVEAASTCVYPSRYSGLARAGNSSCVALCHISFLKPKTPAASMRRWIVGRNICANAGEMP
jgi:hypothetical protein